MTRGVIFTPLSYYYLLAVGSVNSWASLTAPLLSVVYTRNTAYPVFKRFPPAIVAVYRTLSPCGK